MATGDVIHRRLMGQNITSNDGTLNNVTTVAGTTFALYDHDAVNSTTTIVGINLWFPGDQFVPVSTSSFGPQVSELASPPYKRWI